MECLPMKCAACRWEHKRTIGRFPCNNCIGLIPDAEYDFFMPPDQPEMFGPAELAKCRSCGRKVHIIYGQRGYKYIRCKCGNSLQAKVTVDEIMRRWNNKLPSMTKMWRVKK